MLCCSSSFPSEIHPSQSIHFPYHHHHPTDQIMNFHNKQNKLASSWMNPTNGFHYSLLALLPSLVIHSSVSVLRPKSIHPPSSNPITTSNFPMAWAETMREHERKDKQKYITTERKDRPYNIINLQQQNEQYALDAFYL